MIKKLKITGLFNAEAIDDYTPQDYMGSVDPCTAVSSNTGSRMRYRPLCGGISASHYNVLGGTLGAILNDAATGLPLLLGNNHTLANCSTITTPRAQVGDAIMQPSPIDGGSYPQDIVATLERWIPYDNVGGYNTVDAAVAKPLPGMLTTDLILSSMNDEEFRQPSGVEKAYVGMKVKKYGRTGGVSHGTVVDTDVSTVIPYPVGNLEIPYKDCLLIEINTCDGDSGSVYVTDDDEDHMVGLHFAGTYSENNKRYAVACKMQNVCRQLGLVPI